MNLLLAILGAFSALWKGLGLLAQSLYFKRAKEAGHTEAELAISKKNVENIGTRKDVEEAIDRMDANELERLLNNRVGGSD